MDALPAVRTKTKTKVKGTRDTRGRGAHGPKGPQSDYPKGPQRTRQEQTTKWLQRSKGTTHEHRSTATF